MLNKKFSCIFPKVFQATKWKNCQRKLKRKKPQSIKLFIQEILQWKYLNCLVHKLSDIIDHKEISFVKFFLYTFFFLLRDKRFKRMLEYSRPLIHFSIPSIFFFINSSVHLKFNKLIKRKIGKLNRHNDWNSINYDQIPFNFLNWFNFLPSFILCYFSSSKASCCYAVFSLSIILWWKILINYNFQNESE